MSDTAIIVENLGKSYLVGHQAAPAERYTALRDVVARNVRTLARKTRDMLHGRPIVQGDEVEEFWALKDVSFEVKQGETLGIIGRNGAGKSTLLKVLSRITEPTQGRITLNGRVASLLEVGTGFHPELTGRENIFLNGAILGMTRREIQHKFDEIVAFAEVEQFLDTPVKRYSSGMYVRLAFAVAAHLEPEILVVDEVLAVGDAQFQKKCLGKMGDVAKAGRTVLFVSHQMAAIQRLCTKVVVLSKGHQSFNGEVEDAISHYLEVPPIDSANGSIPQNFKRTGTGEIRLTGFRVEDGDGRSLTTVACGKSLTLAFDYQAKPGISVRDVSLGVSLHNQLGDTLAVLYSDYQGIVFSDCAGSGTLRCTIPDLPLSFGRYFVGARVVKHQEELDWPRGHIGEFDVQAGDYYGIGSMPHSGTGPLLFRANWEKSGPQITKS